MKTVFADTVYWVALLTGSDPWAELASSLHHRLLDGALADQFMGKLRSVLESWSEEVL